MRIIIVPIGSTLLPFEELVKNANRQFAGEMVLYRGPSQMEDTINAFFETKDKRQVLERNVGVTTVFLRVGAETVLCRSLEALENACLGAVPEIVKTRKSMKKRHARAESPKRVDVGERFPGAVYSRENAVTVSKLIALMKPWEPHKPVLNLG